MCSSSRSNVICMSWMENFVSSQYPSPGDGKIIAVIVSVYDGDGADALSAIKEAGGITIAQQLETAIQPDMPKSAIASGWIDFILSPEDIARKIRQIAGEA